MHQHKLHKKRAELILPWPMEVQFVTMTDIQNPHTLKSTVLTVRTKHMRIHAHTHTHIHHLSCVCLFFTFDILLSESEFKWWKKIQRLSIRPQKMHTYNNNNGWIDGWKNNDECFHWEHARTNYRAVRHTHSRTYSVMCVRCTMSLFYVFSRSIVLWCTYA